MNVRLNKAILELNELLAEQEGIQPVKLDDIEKAVILIAKERHSAYDYSSQYRARLCIEFSKLLTIGSQNNPKEDRHTERNCIVSGCGFWVSFDLDNSIGRCGLLTDDSNKE